jgi:hypothetical protein
MQSEILVNNFSNQKNLTRIQRIFQGIFIVIWAWSYEQKFSDLRNLQKTLENVKPPIFVRKVRKII